MIWVLIIVNAGVAISGYPSLDSCNAARRENGLLYRTSYCVPMPKDGTIHTRGTPQ